MSILKKIKNLFVEELTAEELKDRFLAQGFDLDEFLDSPFNQMEISEIADLMNYDIIFKGNSISPIYRRPKRFYKWEMKQIKKGGR